ncbi:MAG: PrsW family glutamic-type intramembrane protease [Rhizomicrobium sp.]|jgi:RsiW-degrading membrane proteinase PrsW (M82 family)
MPTHFIPELCLGLGPVALLVAALQWLDSFKLVSMRMVLVAVMLGVLAAVLSYAASGAALDLLHLHFSTYSRFVAPFLEEAFKSAVVIALFARNRIGFMIDAIILGLAVGAGFGAAENIYYAYAFPEANVGVWMVRGLGTAVMHAGVTALFAVCAQVLRERHEEDGAAAYLPGFLAAASLHLIFNQFTHWPLLSAAGTIVALPLALLFLFDKSEHEAHSWLIHDHENLEHLLEEIRTGRFAQSEAGRFILASGARFDREVVTLEFEYIKLHTELVLRAEQNLLARERAEKVPPATRETHEQFRRLHEIERGIGPTVMAVLWPHLKFSRRELFELHRLESAAS